MIAATTGGDAWTRRASPYWLAGASSICTHVEYVTPARVTIHPGIRLWNGNL
jgi:hypothetical protein